MKRHRQSPDPVGAEKADRKADPSNFKICPRPPSREPGMAMVLVAHRAIFHSRTRQPGLVAPARLIVRLGRANTVMASAASPRW